MTWRRRFARSGVEAKYLAPASTDLVEVEGGSSIESGDFYGMDKGEMPMKVGALARGTGVDTDRRGRQTLLRRFSSPSGHELGGPEEPWARMVAAGYATRGRPRHREVDVRPMPEDLAFVEYAVMPSRVVDQNLYEVQGLGGKA